MISKTLRMESLDTVLDDVLSGIVPVWPLQDFVAVNPFQGLTQYDFLTALRSESSVRDIEMLMPLSYYQRLFGNHQITRSDINQAIIECRDRYPEHYDDVEVGKIMRSLEESVHASESRPSRRRFLTFAERIDQQRGTSWSSAIVNEISRHCAAHFDKGQALWPSPWRKLPLYAAWQEIASIDRRMEKLGAIGFGVFAAGLPQSSRECIELLLHLLNVPEEEWRQFLLCELYSVSGWASYIQYRCRNAEMEDRANKDLLGLLAIRLAYDQGIARTIPYANKSSKDTQANDQPRSRSDHHTEAKDTTYVRFALQTACEIAFRNKMRDLLGAFTRQADTPKLAQLVFCIDVRSEVMRRHIESVTDRVATFGFAGFFGVPMEYVSLGGLDRRAQCPVLLKPGFRIEETLRDTDEATKQQAKDNRLSARLLRRVWKLFRLSATSCFSFVEAFGLLYVVKLIGDAFGLTPRSDHGQYDGVLSSQRHKLGPGIDRLGDSGLSIDQKVELGYGILRNLGLTTNFSRLIVFCGHGSQSTNNPYSAGLDCGACGGHSGEPNARVAAAILNSPEVRLGLLGRGLEVPTDVWFLAASHNTTTDQIEFFDIDCLPDSHADDWRQLVTWMGRATILTRAERAVKLGTSSKHLLHRARDWSEVRPEWGLAGNAAFIVAPRERTTGRNLDGRVFLHSYDYRLDPDLSTLELIMTAPMIVTSWINLQYYASTVDNRSFGSGNKLIHNVVGQFGVFEGNSGDLRTGLPWQSVHDGGEVQHPPLRLLVVIEAPREAIDSILDRHSMVADLMLNGWLLLMVIDDGRFYRFSSSGQWIQETDMSLNTT